MDIKEIAKDQAFADLREVFDKAKNAGKDVYYESFNSAENEFTLSYGGEQRTFSQDKIGYENARFWIEDMMAGKYAPNPPGGNGGASNPPKQSDEPYQVEMDDEYWQMLMNQATADSMEYVEDAIAIQNSVADSIKFADNADKGFEKSITDAIEAIETLKTQLNDKEFQEATDKLTDILQGGPKEITLMDEEIKLLEDALGRSTDWKANPEINKLFTDMKQKYPIRYAMTEIRGHVNDAETELKKIFDEVKDVKQYYAVALDSYKNTLKATGTALAYNIQDNLCAIKTSALDTLRSSLEMSAKALNYAATAFIDLADKSKNAIMKCVRGISKFVDKSLDMITLGGYSKLSHCIEKHNEEAYSKLPDDSFLKKACSFTHNAIEKFRGEDSDTYWKDVQDNAFLWGNIKDENGKVVEYDKSPVQCAQDGITNTITKINNKLTEMKDNAKDALENAGKQVVKVCKTATNNVKAEAFGIKAEIADRLADVYERKANRISAKKQKLLETDTKLFEIQTQLESTLHKLTAITPFVRSEYKKNPATENILNILESAEPSKEVDFLKEMINKEVAKEEKAFNKEQNKAERQHNAKVAGNEIKTTYTEEMLSLVQDDMDKNIKKLEKAQAKLEKLEGKADHFKDVKLEANIAKATAQGKTNDGNEVADDIGERC